MRGIGLLDRILSLGSLLVWGGNLVALADLLYTIVKGIRPSGTIFFWCLMIVLVGMSFDESYRRRQRKREGFAAGPRVFNPVGAPGWTGPQAR